jgi:hypothetical protein
MYVGEWLYMYTIFLIDDDYWELSGKYRRTFMPITAAILENTAL